MVLGHLISGRGMSLAPLLAADRLLGDCKRDLGAFDAATGALPRVFSQKLEFIDDRPLGIRHRGTTSTR